ncbi:hypothetical protein [Eisenbergiella porci]|uniref:hypothetical protein n=1 Tax=Eisenbergiella porci TaxID=2652274 RepID=UPI002A83ED69|nr:hypothetical protein [Eisenbergiella porci]
MKKIGELIFLAMLALYFGVSCVFMIKCAASDRDIIALFIGIASFIFCWFFCDMSIYILKNNKYKK